MELPQKMVLTVLRLGEFLHCFDVLAIFDGNYTTTTLAIGDHDPLQACDDAAMAGPR